MNAAGAAAGYHDRVSACEFGAAITVASKKAGEAGGVRIRR